MKFAAGHIPDEPTAIAVVLPELVRLYGRKHIEDDETVSCHAGRQ
ncbi:MAG: hypothetical protein AB7O65_08520 [Candidatus Korobacteraceae bacterium]